MERIELELARLTHDEHLAAKALAESKGQSFEALTPLERYKLAVEAKG